MAYNHLIKIGDWYHPRRFGRREGDPDGRLSVEIKVSFCVDCRSCTKRGQETKKRLESLGLSDVRWERDGEILSLPYPDGDVLEYLEKIFGVPVRRVALL